MIGGRTHASATADLSRAAASPSGGATTPDATHREPAATHATQAAPVKPRNRYLQSDPWNAPGEISAPKPAARPIAAEPVEQLPLAPVGLANYVFPVQRSYETERIMVTDHSAMLPDLR